MENHPVWDVYDLYRTARLNVKYNAGRLRKLSSWNFWMEFILACIVPTSGVAGLTLWGTAYGKAAWSVLASIASVVAVAKPLLGLAKKIRRLEEICADYRALEHNVYGIVMRIRQEGVYDEQARRMFETAYKRKGELVVISVENEEDRELKQACEAEVLSELPTESFFIPNDQRNGDEHHVRREAATAVHSPTAISQAASNSSSNSA